MQVLPIKILDSNCHNYTNNLNFKSTIKATVPVAGAIKRDTKILFEDIIHAYREIKPVLEQKTDEGLAYLSEIYPNITIQDNLIFHHCGDDDSSISIRVAESPKYRGLTHLSRRILNRSTGKYSTSEAYMLDGNERLIKDFSPQHSNRFPEYRTYFTQEEIDEKGFDENLLKLLKDLDLALLKFRHVLSKNSDKHLKLPNGKVPYTTIMDLRSAFNTCDEITKRMNKIPHKLALSVNKEFPSYLAITGLKTYAFRNLGEENLTINLSSVEKNGEEYKRLSVYDNEGKPIRTFLIQNEEKFVSNITQAYPNNFPKKLAFANSEEVEKEYLPEFNKYFTLYLNALKEYQKHVDKRVDKYLYKDIDGEFSEDMKNLLGEALEWYNIAKIKLRKLPAKKAAEVKSEVAGMELDSGKKGAWFYGFDGNKTVNLLPIESNKHSGLCRITIIDNDSGETQMYLIKDLKYVVKNFNPKYPQVLPAYLIYLNEAELQDLNLEPYARFLKTKTEALARVSDEAFEHRFELKTREPNLLKTPRISRTSTERKPRKKNIYNSAEYKQLIKECKKQFNDAIKNISSGLEGFNATMQNIQEKLADFYKKEQ